MSWECRYKSGDHCNRLDAECDPGRTGCVLHGRFTFPFAPEKNTAATRPEGDATGSTEPRKRPPRGEARPDND